MQQNLNRLPEWFMARYYQIDTVARLAGFFWLDEAAMSRMIGSETRVNTDDLHYFDKQSAVMPVPPELRLPRFQANMLPYIEQSNDALRAAARDQQYMAQLVANYGFYSDPRDLIRAYCRMPDNGNVLFWMAREFSDQLPDYATLCRTPFRQASR
jgi:spermidine synthase